MLCVKTMICSFAINSLKITLILQPGHNDVKIGLACAHVVTIKNTPQKYSRSRF